MSNGDAMANISHFNVSDVALYYQGLVALEQPTAVHFRQVPGFKQSGHEASTARPTSLT